MVGGTLLFSLMAAYPLARIRFPGREAIFVVILATLMVPETVTMVPNFLTVSWLHRVSAVPWLNNWPALTIPFMTSAFSVFLLRQFMRGIPGDLWEAARIDGAGHLRFLFQVVLPLCRAPLLTVGMLAFIGSWNALGWPLLVTNTPAWRPIAVGLQKFVTEAGPEVPPADGGRGDRHGARPGGLRAGSEGVHRGDLHVRDEGMKPTHRRWWMVAVAGLAAGCGGGDAPAPAVDVESVDPQGQEVVFWYQHQRARERALKEMIADFNGTNPHGIRVRGEFAGSYGDIYNKMVVGLQGGNVADLVVAYQNQAREYLLADGIVDLIPYMTSPRWGLSQAAAADYVGAFLHQDRIGGRQIALPPNRSIEVLYYNMDWLRELGAPGPPATWEEFAQMCRAARDQPFSGNPAGVRSLGFVLEEDASRAASMTFSRGGISSIPRAPRTGWTPPR